MNISLAGIIAVLSYAIALCGILPLFPWLTLLPRLLLAGGVLASLWQDRRGVWPLKNWMLNVSTLPLFFFYAVQFNRSNAVQPVVSVLAIMLTVRLLGEKSSRHYLQMYVLSLFCLASSSLFDLTPLFLVYLGLLLFLIPLSLVLLTFYAQDSNLVLTRVDLRRVVTAGLMMPLATLPLLVFFFPILPRTQIPLWNLLSAPLARSSGFTDKVEPGGSSSVSESATTAFRAELPRQPQQQLYWRGTVFNQLVGNRWVRDPAVPQEVIVYGSPHVSQVIFPEPGPSRFLIALDSPAALTFFRATRFPDGIFEMPAVSGRRQSYSADSSTAGILPVVSKINRPFYLRLPDTVSVRLRTFAEEIRKRGASDSEVITLLENHFRNGNYRYSMQGLPTGDRALEIFLFESRQGHCEFFASAFATLARGAGVPTRMVAGYLGGEYNELGGYYLVSEQMAHVWVEVFLDGRGWVRIDPSSLAVNAGGIWSESRRRSLAMRLRLAVDSFDHAWNRSVISYDFERQVIAARTASKWFQTISWKQVFSLTGGPVLVVVLVSGIVWLSTTKRRLIPSAEERLLARFYRRLQQDTGIRVNKGNRQGMFELAAATDNQKVRKFAEVYAGAVYRDRKLTAGERARLKQLLRDGFRSD